MMHHTDHDAHHAMQRRARFDVELIDNGATCIVVAHDAAARSVLRAMLGCYWSAVAWDAVPRITAALVPLGFTIESR